MVVMSLVGVLVAFPMKRRFINEDQLPFPEGRACGVVLDALYHGAEGEGVYKAKLLGVTAGLTAFYQFLVGDGLQRLVQFKLLRFDRWFGWTEPWHFHERIDRLLLHARREIPAVDAEDSRHGIPHARAAARARRRDARRGRIDGNPRRDQCRARNGGELYGARADHDCARRHRAADWAGWRASCR